jgi:hypothetical protein
MENSSLHVMKRFIDDNGTFEIHVPTTYKYSLQKEIVHTFQEYEIWKSDSFQFSIQEAKKENEKNNFLQLVKTTPVIKIGNLDYHCFPDNSNKDFTTKIWGRLFDNKFVLFTLTHQNNPDKDLDNQSIEEKVLRAHSSIKSFRIIEEGKSKNEINAYRFGMFMQGYGATAMMLDKAISNKSFIEATCLVANLIDAQLRIGIVLKTQLISLNSKIETQWIYQGAKDKKMSEKDIYKKALELSIIDKSFFDELYALYDNRNRVVHRFIISEITIAEVEEIAYQYYVKFEALNKIIYDIESEQIKLNVGMTMNSDGKVNLDTKDFIMGKIGKLNYFEEKEKAE